MIDTNKHKMIKCILTVPCMMHLMINNEHLTLFMALGCINTKLSAQMFAPKTLKSPKCNRSASLSPESCFNVFTHKRLLVACSSIKI